MASATPASKWFPFAAHFEHMVSLHAPAEAHVHLIRTIGMLCRTHHAASAKFQVRVEEPSSGKACYPGPHIKPRLHNVMQTLISVTFQASFPVPLAIFCWPEKEQAKLFRQDS